MANLLCEGGHLPKSEIEVYAYGLQIGAEMLINLLTTITIGLCMGQLLESMMLFAGYMMLRSYTGGYHAKTFWACYVMSSLLVIILLLICKLTPDHAYLFLCILSILLSFPIIYRLSPVQTPSKPLDDYERAHHRKQSHSRILLETLLTCVLIVVGQYKYAFVLSMGIVSIACLMVVGAVRNQIYPIGGLKE